MNTAWRAGFYMISVLAVLSLILSVIAFFGEHGWLWDLTSHFRLLYLIIHLIFLMLFITWYRFSVFTDRKIAALFTITVLVTGLNASQIIPYFMPIYTQANAYHTVGSDLKLMHMNVLGTNRNSNAVRSAIEGAKPDLLILEEYNSWWKNALEGNGSLKPFRYHYVVPFGNDGIYSKIPLNQILLDYVTPGKDPTTKVQFTMGGEPVTLLMVHPRPPVKPDWYERHKRHFSHWEQNYTHYGKNVIVMGDLNTSPWSYTFRHFLAVTHLRDSQQGFGIQPSWPTFLPRLNIPMPMPFIPIDHVLVSNRFVVLNRHTGPFTGSDHLPVIIELGLLKP